MAGRRSSGAGDDTSAELGIAFQFLRALWELNHALESASRSMKKRLGVTGPERVFIRVVGARPGITPREIARVLRVHPSNITPIIKRLETRRLVARGRNPEDARSFHMYLTPEGQRVDALRVGTIEAVVNDVIAATDASDVDAASALLVKLAQRLVSSLAAPGRSSRPARAPGR